MILLAGEQPAGEQAPQSGAFWVMFAPLIVLFLMYQFMVARPQRRDQAKRDDMLKQLKKNDPVVTIGGIYGTVANLSEDGSEVTLKVDDNTRLRFRRDAIREVIVKTSTTPQATPVK
ncbi:MAG: preprotein translocase subunit YajC [Planctomycetaceae bacterium]